MPMDKDPTVNLSLWRSSKPVLTRRQLWHTDPEMSMRIEINELTDYKLENSLTTLLARTNGSCLGREMDVKMAFLNGPLKEDASMLSQPDGLLIDHLRKCLQSRKSSIYADHAGYVDTRKSTSGGTQFLGDKSVSWMSKKQDCPSNVLSRWPSAQASDTKKPQRYESMLETSEVILMFLTMKMEILLEPSIKTKSWIHKYGDGDALFQLKTDSLPHAHAQTTK
ncbi:hypothetical protein Tco_0162668 [Tanacetum coccineum]